MVRENHHHPFFPLVEGNKNGIFLGQSFRYVFSALAGSDTGPELLSNQSNTSLSAGYLAFLTFQPTFFPTERQIFLYFSRYCSIIYFSANVPGKTNEAKISIQTQHASNSNKCIGLSLSSKSRNVFFLVFFLALIL